MDGMERNPFHATGASSLTVLPVHSRAGNVRRCAKISFPVVRKSCSDDLRGALAGDLGCLAADLLLRLGDPGKGPLVEFGNGARATAFGMHQRADHDLNGARILGPA